MWSYSNCQVQGRGHIKNKVPCQDKTKTVFENDTYVIALADGAGSAKLSHYGADCVVKSTTELFTENFDKLYSNPDGRKVKIQIIDKVLADIKAKADELECTSKDLASTMLAVAVNSDRFIIVHIGDGVVGYLDDSELKIASSPSNGEHANETYFVTSKDAINTMKLFKGNIKNIAGFILMSDGTEQSLYNKKNNSLNQVVIKLMQRNILLDKNVMCKQLESTFKNIINTRTYDDCSVALLCRECGALHSLSKLNIAEKYELYGVKTCDKNAVKRVNRYDLIMKLLKQPSSCKVISNKIHLKPKYTKNHLQRLCGLGLVKYENGLYHL